MDWHTWHEGYARRGSTQDRRLRVVRQRVREALDSCPPGPVRALSVCAGQGLDLIGALADHPRRDDVTARLVELDARNAEAAAAGARAAGLRGVEVVVGDASLSGHYDDLAPAQLVLICGLFGNITDEDIARTLDRATHLCAPGGTLVWTRGRYEPDFVPTICRWLEERGFEEIALTDPALRFGVGAHRFHGKPRPLEGPDLPMFTFIGYDLLIRTF
jgi:hypothetical protein